MRNDRSILPDLCGRDFHLEHNYMDSVWGSKNGLDMGLHSLSPAHEGSSGVGFSRDFPLARSGRDSVVQNPVS